MKRKAGNTQTKNAFKSRIPNTSFLAVIVDRKTSWLVESPLYFYETKRNLFRTCVF